MKLKENNIYVQIAMTLCIASLILCGVLNCTRATKPDTAFLQEYAVYPTEGETTRIMFNPLNILSISYDVDLGEYAIYYDDGDAIDYDYLAYASGYEEWPSEEYTDASLCIRMSIDKETFYELLEITNKPIAEQLDFTDREVYYIQESYENGKFHYQLIKNNL